MDPAIIAGGLGLFLLGFTLFYIAVFGRPPPLNIGLKPSSFFDNGKGASAEVSAPPRVLSRGERLFLGTGGVLCWVLAGVMVVPQLVDSGEEEAQPEQQQGANTSTGNIDPVGSPDVCPPIPEGKFLVGAYYRREASDVLPTQVVDQDDRASFKNPEALWIATDGRPVDNPNIPLRADIIEVVEAFGSAEAVVEYNACALQPDA